MNRAVGFCGSNAGRKRASACSAQNCGVPSAPTRRSTRSGATNIRLVSSKRPASMRSIQMVKASPKAARVSAVGQMKSAITVPPASTTRSHIHPMRRACSIRSGWVKPRSRDRFARTASALNTTALSSGASTLASVVLPAPGRPMIRIRRISIPQWARAFEERANRAPTPALLINMRWRRNLRGHASTADSGGFLEKGQCADFDAFARPRIRRRGRIVEGGVGGPAGATVLQRVVDLEDQRFLAPHPGQPVPAVLGIVGDGIGLADPIGIAALIHHEIIGRDAAGVTDGEREALDRVADRPPHLHDGEPALQKIVGLLRKKVAHALRAGPFGVVVVHAAHHLADLACLALLVISGAQRMIKHHHARGPALGLHQLFHLWIVDATDLVLIEEVRDRGIVTHEAEAFAVEHERVAVQPGIVDGYMARIDGAAGAHISAARTGRLGEQLLPVIDDIVDRGIDGFADGVALQNLNHGHLPARLAAPATARLRMRDRRYRCTDRALQSTIPCLSSAGMPQRTVSIRRASPNRNLLLEAANAECSSTATTHARTSAASRVRQRNHNLEERADG